jgi:hypothetical protein
VIQWPSAATVNAFIEDTCVLAVIAYTMGRGKLLAAVYDAGRSRRREVLLGILYGLIASSEAIFPGDRAPYVTSGLLLCLSAALGTPLIACEATIVSMLAFAAMGLFHDLLPTLACGAAALLAAILLKSFKERNVHAFALLIAVIGQGCAVIVSGVLRIYRPEMLLSIPANAFGIVVVLVILDDARIRTQSAANALAVSEMQASMREAQLQDLRARVHPHFMFNALSAIAALCRLDPPRAEKAVVALGDVMRTSLMTPADDTIDLQTEIKCVKNYLEIEKLRLGDRLKLTWAVDPATLTDRLPAFTLQTLVENAVIHGASKSKGATEICIGSRRNAKRTLIYVRDGGPGFARKVNLQVEDSGHGLPIVHKRLTRVCGEKARLRLFSSPGRGALVAFSIAHDDRPKPHRSGSRR